MRKGWFSTVRKGEENKRTSNRRGFSCSVYLINKVDSTPVGIEEEELCGKIGGVGFSECQSRGV